MNLLKFETLKFLKSKKNIIITIIFTILSLIYVLLMQNLNLQYQKGLVDNIKFNTDSISETIQDLEVRQKNEPGNSAIQDIIDGYRSEIELNNQLIKAISSNDYTTQLKVEIEKDKNLLKGIQENSIVSAESTESISQRIQKNQYLLQHNIKPTLENVNPQGFNILKLLSGNIFPFLLPIIVLIMGSDIVSKEFDEGTYKFLFSQPIKKWKIIMSKLIASYLSVVFMVLSSLIITFIVAGFTNGFGDANYPVAYVDGIFTFGANLDKINFIPISQFTIFLFAFYLILILFFISFSTLLSLLAKSTSLSMSLSILITSIFFILQRTELFNSIAHYIPFSFNNLVDLLNGNLGIATDNNKLTLLYGGIILGVYSLTFILLAIFRINKGNLTN